MRCVELELAGVLVIEPEVFHDDRGFFLETYNRQRYAVLPGLDQEFVQDNYSHSKRGVLRGLHLQCRRPQGKLIRALTGRIWDVAVDVDPRSSTFRKWVAVELDGDNRKQLYIPPGYAHGFCVLSESADVEYKCTALRDPGDEAGIRWDDAALAIVWPVNVPILSERDRNNPALEEYLRGRE